MPVKLSVNVDHVATVREARKIDQPDPVAAAAMAELAGADGITIHLRGDRRHIQERDLELLRKTVKTKLNVEMATTQEMTRIACEVRPDIVTFVPERPDEITTEGGLNLLHAREAVKSAAAVLAEHDIIVSVFIDPDLDQIKVAREVGAKVVEINTGRYCDARKREDREREYRQIVDVVRLAAKLRLDVAAGHGLDYKNVQPIAAILEIRELNIGHTIIGRAIYVGLDQAVREMIAAIREGRTAAE
ncbi:MAG: pyridoxine 5'-phosphate synthase [Candidatus Lernaella stagnicola]|nr:pyridoxine 5'-phosphate synthase [Candidatus Lernaella stagnicola]